VLCCQSAHPVELLPCQLGERLRELAGHNIAEEVGKRHAPLVGGSLSFFDRGHRKAWADDDPMIGPNH
jgi:hypothetical protein